MQIVYTHTHICHITSTLLSVQLNSLENKGIHLVLKARVGWKTEREAVDWGPSEIKSHNWDYGLKLGPLERLCHQSEDSLRKNSSLSRRKFAKE